MNKKAFILPLSIGLVLSSCSEGRNLFLADAMEVIGSVSDYVQSTSFLLPATFECTLEFEDFKSTVAYDGGTRRLYVESQNGEALSAQSAYIEDGYIKECRLVDGEYVIFSYPFESPEAQFRTFAKPYISSCLELLRAIPSRAYDILEGIQSSLITDVEDAFDYQVLSADDTTFEIFLTRTVEGTDMLLYASISDYYLEDYQIVYGDHALRISYSYEMPDFPDIPATDSADQEIREANWQETDITKTLEYLSENVMSAPEEGKYRYIEGDGSRIYKQDIFDNYGGSFSHFASIDEESTGLFPTSLSIYFPDEEGGIFSWLSTCLEDEAYVDPYIGLGTVTEEERDLAKEEALETIRSEETEARALALEIAEKEEAKSYIDGNCRLLFTAEAYALFYQGILLSYSNNGATCRYYAYSGYPSANEEAEE